MFLSVDAQCVVPMRTIERAFDRAFRFRDATRDAFEQRVARSWPNPTVETSCFEGDCGAPDLDLASADLSEICARADIDHSVGPVWHTIGGADAGYARWRRFLSEGLESYARLRNDAAVRWPRGVSRMSPYLHYGFVSPFRIAREALEVGGTGAEKFLDELLVWRELSHNFCFHTPAPGAFESLPDWAQETLLRHAADARPATMSLERLMRGKTGDPLWDAAQTSLVLHGELHNNVRMTWGKALLAWAKHPRDALRLLLYLNHRFALDGSDPNSYGGILWCLGLFDRPFSPGKAVFGSVRTRPTDVHSGRLDVSAFRARLGSVSRRHTMSVAVIGSGLAGLAAARTLSDHGLSVTVFDKGRNPGGRACSRTTRSGPRFDHGAQYFTARREHFRMLVRSWVEDGVVAEWRPRRGVYDEGGLRAAPDTEEGCYVGVPNMGRLGDHLAADLEVRQSTRVGRVERRDDGRWILSTDTGDALGTFDVLVCTVPPPQVTSLFGDETLLPEEIARVHMRPCWALMLELEPPTPVPFDGIFVGQGALDWIGRDSSKPGREPGERWVLHADPEWSDARVDRSEQDIAHELLTAFTGVTGVRPEVNRSWLHRWLFARPVDALGEGCLWDDRRRVAFAGDWCLGARVEAAFLSGQAVAGRVLGLPDVGPAGVDASTTID
jgi:predicted NAD/FAD-dependent oxidoreductase